MNKVPFPTVTIATVTYNAEKTLPCTLESVASQTFPHIEHLIIDGCSKDQTMELIHRYVDANTGKTCPHDIRVVREPDKGLYDAMNKALEHATGDYIVFLNAGDRLHSPDTLQQVFGHIDMNASLPAILYGETDWVDGQGRFIRHRRLQAPKQLTWKKFRHGMLVCHQSFYVRTDLARQELYDLNFRFSADYDWCIRIMRTAARRKLPMKNAGIIVADYLDGGMTTQNHRRSLMERFRVMAHHYGIITAAAMHLWFVARAVVKK